MDTITKRELIERISEKYGVHRNTVRTVVQAFLDEVVDQVIKENRLEFRDFGVFEVRARAPRMAQNPKTMAPVRVDARKTVKFKAGRLMREGLEKNGKPVLEIKPKRRAKAAVT